MMVNVARIAAVSYLNTIPFIYGIEHEGNLRAELLLTPPASCAKNFADRKADIALVPAAAVPSLEDAQVVTEYCIGAVGPVRTVVLLSNGPIETARRVFLDAHSLTSVQLAGYLLAKHWKVAPEYYALEDYSQLDHALPGDAFLLIGDKVFDHEERFAYSYDLAAEWIKATRLPFAFAVWIARKDVDPAVVDELQRALTFGVEHTYEAVLKYGFDRKPYDAYGYLTQNIDYIFDNQKRKALQKFWDSGIKVAPRANPG
ncbi:menaquinone biosynthetic enzyme MqnA/MqnD family protein [uncultured Alistipes sp.]|uniref:menaquinone biosynthetic enzyme MqnA/MqnD family protein n=1 Tax=uncultured Alistipes sp. TaxID=538949 RepID=UPI0025EE8339|nr:menaquinone biosynthesis protein [uncultured Alistipes sp.]